MHFAVWSGPRNISTAMMRSWENRTDCFVCDEPLYAHYLNETGLDHPGAEEVIASQDTDWRAVVDWLTNSIPAGKSVFYQKHMAHHLLPDIELDWLDKLDHALLIRQPSEMVTSLIDFIPSPVLTDTGLPQQLKLLNHLKAIGRPAMVIEAREVLDNPAAMLTAICEKVGIEFQPSMLQWSAGKRDTDGVWAKYWYDKVEQTTGFARYRPKNISVPDDLVELVSECNEIYEQLYALRIRV